MFLSVFINPIVIIGIVLAIIILAVIIFIILFTSPQANKAGWTTEIQKKLNEKNIPYQLLNSKKGKREHLFVYKCTHHEQMFFF